MEATRIIMTEVICPEGRYTKFNLKDGGGFIGAVDRKDGKYWVYAGWPFFDEVGTRTRKASAIELAKAAIRRFIPDAEFKKNVITIKEK